MLVVRFLHKCIEGSRARTAPNTLSNAISDTNNEPAPDISDERSHRNSFAAAAPHPAGRARYQKALSEELGVRPRTNPLRLEWEALDFKIGKAPPPPPRPPPQACHYRSRLPTRHHSFEVLYVPVCRHTCSRTCTAMPSTVRWWR